VVSAVNQFFLLEVLSPVNNRKSVSRRFPSVLRSQPGPGSGYFCPIIHNQTIILQKNENLIRYRLAGGFAAG
jgi:hypothetical protein